MTVSLDNQPAYGITAASRLTGIPLDTLRVWERRYNLVTPSRSSDNKRLYTLDDIARLKLIKSLVDHGHAISSVAHLTEDALAELMRAHLTPPPNQARDGLPCRVLAFGDSLPFVLRQWKGNLALLDLLGSHQSFADFEEAAVAQKPDILLLEMPVLRQEGNNQLRELIFRANPRRTIVIYAFGMKNLRDELDKMGVCLLRSPVTIGQLEQVCRTEAGNQPATLAVQGNESGIIMDVPDRRYDSEMLVAVSSATSKIQCECPQHLTDLLFRLNAFEDYSADCENRNERDAAVHEHLRLATAQARTVLEAALDYLIQSEGIQLDRLVGFAQSDESFS